MPPSGGFLYLFLRSDVLPLWRFRTGASTLAFFCTGVLLSVCSIHTVVCDGAVRGFRLLRRHNRGIACGGHPRKEYEAL